MQAPPLLTISLLQRRPHADASGPLCGYFDMHIKGQAGGSQLSRRPVTAVVARPAGEVACVLHRFSVCVCVRFGLRRDTKRWNLLGGEEGLHYKSLPPVKDG